MQPLYFAGRALETERVIKVHDKFTGAEIAEVCAADEALVRDAIGRAFAARDSLRRMPTFQRAEVLEDVAARLELRRTELVDMLVQEVGKPITFARGEVDRTLDTFRIAAREALRTGGEIVPLESSPASAGYRGVWKRVPVGVCGFITPFNFPLNLVAHKVAPAIAAGCPFVLKPASAAPLSALAIGAALAESGLPAGAFSILPARGSVAEPIVTDSRVAKLSFTGSDEVGWAMKRRAGKKRVTLELGGNAAVIIDETADLDAAVERVVFGAFYQGGQSCISVQRIIVVDSVYEAFRTRFIAAVRAVVVGDPRSPETLIGPVITEGDAARIVAWVQSACDAGARLLVGGGRDGVLVEATVLEDVPAGQEILEDEVFGPAAVLIRVSDFEAALREANRTRFGLQAGVFTRDLHRAQRAWDELEVGGVIVGDVPSWRADAMPYGGVKDSGLGREGPAFAIEEMTERRLFVVRDAPPDAT